MPQVPFHTLAPQVGRLWPRGAPGYDRARADAIWNKRLDQRHSPDAIVRCTSAAQVAAAVRFAAQEELRVALRGSGHSYIAAPLRDGGLLLDCGGMDTIGIDVASRTARIGPGVRGGDLIETLAAHDLAFPIGHCSTVAMGGYLLSGGIGWNNGEWGPACKHLRAIEAVLANGSIVRATPNEHSDLFWAARGAGCGFFAAITGFELDLQPLPRAAWLVTTSFPAHSAPQLRDWLNAAVIAAHPAAEIMCLLGPDLHSGAPALTVRAIAVGDTAEEAAKRVASFRAPPTNVERLAALEERALDFTELTRLSAMPDGKRVAADQLWSDAAIGDLAAAVHHLADRPSPSSTINLVTPGGAGRIPHMPDETAGALSMGGGISAGIYAMWDDLSDDRRHLDWVRDVDALLSPFAAGRYVGEADLTAAPDRARQCYSPAAWQRLEAIRDRYDPDRRFFGFPG